MAGPGSKSGGRSEVFRKLARQRREPEPRPESVGELEPESGSASSEGSSKSGLPAGFRARLDGRMLGCAQWLHAPRVKLYSTESPTNC